jgi:hypothetical protein
MAAAAYLSHLRHPQISKRRKPTSTFILLVHCAA